MKIMKGRLTYEEYKDVCHMFDSRFWRIGHGRENLGNAVSKKFPGH